MKTILSIDQGTTGSTALFVNAENLKVISKANFEYPQIYPKPGWVEHNLDAIWDSVNKAIKKAALKANIDFKEIIAIGITNQRETTCAYNKKGEPLHNAIVWQDRRTAKYCQEKKVTYKDYQQKTGLPLDPYFSGTKMNWLLNNVDQIKKAAQKNDLKLSTVDTYLLYRLTSGESFKTEASNASRTLLMDLKTCQWDEQLLNLFDIQKSFLPSIEDSFSEFGKTKNHSFLPDGIPILSILGDQQAALFGQAGYKKNALKCTYGTGAFLLLNTGQDIIHSKNGLLTTLAYQYKNQKIYALEGSAYIAGAAVQWLRDNLNFFENSPEIEEFALKANNEQMKNLLFLPFFTGIASPYWKAEAKGAIIGLTRDTGKHQISRACLEGIALSVHDSIETLSKDLGSQIKEIRVDGGASLNHFLLEMQASCFGGTIIRPKVIETTAYGVAMGAKLVLDKLELSDLDNIWEEETRITPKKEDLSYYQQKKKIWNEAIVKLF